ncbi:hypothetical protein [Nannocystis punicea]|uniref:Insulinase family protein n=1 Tax=Nannocystis punicea TaxID=2995304 RepID=A0ABY7H6L3_9BACT|nr:hypothetical protein [Nannocystis poenicansa]WAS94911.1 hypothetical protein O0S08_02010 [Nannocystis poenicansa]
MTRRPRLSACLLSCLLLSLGTACKRKDTVKVEIFDDIAPPALTEALGALAPPWPAPERVVLADGLLVHWLREEGTPAVHLRLVFPTGDLKPALQGAPALIAARSVALELEQLAARLSIRVEFTPRAGRYEIAVHGVDAELSAILAGLGDIFSAPGLDGPLARARKQVAHDLRPPDAEAQALGVLTASLLGAVPANEFITANAVQEAPETALRDAWEALTDPRSALLVVHAGDPLAAHEAGLGDLAGRWKQRVKLIAAGEATEEALVRLRQGPRPAAPPNRHLKKPPIAPLERVDPPPASGRTSRSLLVLGRSLPLATVRDRSLARLVQRHLQAELDIRLSITGNVGLFTIHVPLGAAGRGKPAADPLEEVEAAEQAVDPAEADPLNRRLRRELTVIRDYLRERPLAQDLLGAAQLWLGARMVAASVGGEDWTALWSEALDLSVADGEIVAALARDAETMLAATPDEAAAFITRWLDLEKSEPGWAWVAVGSEADLKGVIAAESNGIQFDPPPE